MFVVQLLQEEVERQQEQVNSLQNMVVVVDETNSEEGAMNDLQIEVYIEPRCNTFNTF